MELLNSALVHAGPVISLAFAANSAHLFTTALDGTVFDLALEGLEEESGAQHPSVVATLEVSHWGGLSALDDGGGVKLSWRPPRARRSIARMNVDNGVIQKHVHFGTTVLCDIYTKTIFLM